MISSSLESEIIIRRNKSWFSFNLKEILEYKDLLWLLVRRDFVARYKQTILGPLWAIIQPVLTAAVFTVIFGKVAKVPTDGAPQFLFYLNGMLFWQLFAGSVTAGGNALQNNAALFGKVYFPRFIPSIATQITQLIPFGIQFIIFLSFYLPYILSPQTQTEFTLVKLLLFPILLMQVLIFSLGVSICYSALTAKYRDFQHALGFIVQLGMYVTPVIYATTAVPEKWRWMIFLNPMAAPVTTSKWIFLSVESLNYENLLFSFGITTLVLAIGLFWFNRIQRTFIDTV